MVEGKQNSLFPARQDCHSVFCRICYTSQLKNRKMLRINRWLDAGWFTNLPWFQGARPDHVQAESSSCCFPRELDELVRFVRPRELVSFDPRHVTRSPPIGKLI